MHSLRSLFVLLLLLIFGPLHAHERGEEVARIHKFKSASTCISTDNSSSEVYILSPSKSHWHGRKIQVQVLEYFSGRVYGADLHPGSGDEANLRTGKADRHLNCAITISYDRETPIDNDGSFLQIVNIGSEGTYGEDQTISPDEIGKQGLVLLAKNGERELWGRLYAVRKKGAKGIQIFDRDFIAERLLRDQTILFVSSGGLAFRIDAKTGEILSRDPNLVVLPLDQWAHAKRDLTKTLQKQCENEAEVKNAKPCEQNWEQLQRRAFIEYLFPNN